MPRRTETIRLEANDWQVAQRPAEEAGYDIIESHRVLISDQTGKGLHS